jgi:hypothetical protein
MPDRTVEASTGHHAAVDDAWHSVQAAADALGLHYRTAWKMGPLGRAAVQRTEAVQGGSYRVRRSDVDA